MGFSSGGKGKGPMSEINVTPLVDVMLVLLVIFMVTAPLMFNGIDLDLPQTKEVNTVKLSDEQLVVSFTNDSKIYIGEELVKRAELISNLKKKVSTLKDKTVFLRADYKLRYGAVASLISELKGSGFLDLALVTEVEE